MTAVSLSPAVATPQADLTDPAALRTIYAQFPQGVVVISAEINGVPDGLVAATFTVGVSLQPPLVSFAVQKSSRTWPRLRAVTDHIGVSVLGPEQSHLVRQIGSKDPAGRFAGVGTRHHPGGALTLEPTPLWFATRVYNEFPAGDHDVVVLEVLNYGVEHNAGALVFHQSELKQLSRLSH
ncbi:flavin reductase family protein [Nesterenkonia alba]|uniref:flavin reductase family protein n=1 Tax=Nesterenkonia alba TaxID=515814 RepID=UPI0003B2E29F|nr:flavin reductase family protein [Nesterenkonia alba]